MKKYFKNFKQSANLSSESAMESGDHFKNGASPKSLMSREKLNHLILYNMKQFMMSMVNALMICMLLTTFSCNKDDNETTPDDPDVPTLPPAETETKSPYRVGDYYNVSGVKGVVFEISNNGQNGKIVSLDEPEDGVVWSINNDLTNASDIDDGMNNMDAIKNISGWKSKYPAFKWCDDKNTNGITGWYYPAINELRRLYGSWNSIEDALVKYGVNFTTSLYCSSTEYDGMHVYYFSFNNGSIDYAYYYHGYSNPNKDRAYYIRAMRKF
jgi:hypothetical protein